MVVVESWWVGLAGWRLIDDKGPAITGTSCWPLGGSLEISDRSSPVRIPLQRAAKGLGGRGIERESMKKKE